MRKLVVLSFISLDGVMQAPGGEKEDMEMGFKYGGWTVPFWDEFSNQVMGEQMGHPYDLVLGRKTYDIFAGYWPNAKDEPLAEGLNNAKKYVASHTLKKLEWQNSVLLEDDAASAIKIIKGQPGPELQVHGSGDFIQTLLEHDLVDEFWLKIFPVTLGQGKRLFGSGTMPANFKLLGCKTSPPGVIFADYARAGEVKTGTYGS